MFLLLFDRFSTLDEILTWTENGCYTNTTVESTPVSQQTLIPCDIQTILHRRSSRSPNENWKKKKQTRFFRTHVFNIFTEKCYFVYHLAKTCLLLQKHEKKTYRHSSKEKLKK